MGNTEGHLMNNNKQALFKPPFPLQPLKPWPIPSARSSQMSCVNEYLTSATHIHAGLVCKPLIQGVIRMQNIHWKENHECYQSYTVSPATSLMNSTEQSMHSHYQAHDDTDLTTVAITLLEIENNHLHTTTLLRISDCYH